MPSADEPPLEPVFSQPRAEAGLLPGGLHYLNITVPKAGTDRYESIVADPSFGRELLFDGGADSFCTVRLDVHGAVHSIVYLGPTPVAALNWLQLVGLPEAAINRLASRYDEGIVPDLPAFLEQNWAVALYHDRFGEFRAALRLELESDADMQALLDGARPAAVGGEQLKVADFLAKLPYYLLLTTYYLLLLTTYYYSLGGRLPRQAAGAEAGPRARAAARLHPDQPEPPRHVPRALQRHHEEDGGHPAHVRRRHHRGRRGARRPGFWHARRE